MSNIQENEYIRTYNGNIGKVTAVGKIDFGKEEMIFDKDFHYYNDEIKLHSPNIIDLIEKGDYVNGLMIEEKYYDYANYEYKLQTPSIKILCAEDIKSIVTKERFIESEYIVC